MTDTGRPWAQVLLALGGVCWTGWVLLMLASGSVDDLIRTLVGVSGFALAIGLLGVVLRLPWVYRFPGGEGCGIAILGGFIFAAGQWLTLPLPAGSTVAEGIIALGVLGLLGGTLLFAGGLLRARRTPPWLGAALIVGTVLFVGFNDGGDIWTLLALPLGLAWFALGGYLLRFPEQPSSHLEPSAISR